MAALQQTIGVEVVLGDTPEKASIDRKRSLSRPQDLTISQCEGIEREAMRAQQQENTPCHWCSEIPYFAGFCNTSGYGRLPEDVSVGFSLGAFRIDNSIVLSS